MSCATLQISPRSLVLKRSSYPGDIPLLDLPLTSLDFACKPPLFSRAISVARRLVCPSWIKNWTQQSRRSCATQRKPLDSSPLSQTPIFLLRPHLIRHRQGSATEDDQEPRDQTTHRPFELNPGRPDLQRSIPHVGHAIQILVSSLFRGFVLHFGASSRISNFERVLETVVSTSAHNRQFPSSVLSTYHLSQHQPQLHSIARYLEASTTLDALTSP